MIGLDGACVHSGLCLYQPHELLAAVYTKISDLEYYFIRLNIMP